MTSRTLTADGHTQTKAEYIAAVIGSGKYESFTDSEPRSDIRQGRRVRGFVDVKMATSRPIGWHTLELRREQRPVADGRPSIGADQQPKLEEVITALTAPQKLTGKGVYDGPCSNSPPRTRANYLSVAKSA